MPCACRDQLYGGYDGVIRAFAVFLLVAFATGLAVALTRYGPANRATLSCMGPKVAALETLNGADHLLGPIPTTFELISPTSISLNV